MIENFYYDMSGGFPLSVVNIYNAGIKIVDDIVFNNWESVYENGVQPTNYIGDIFGTLGGTPDFGCVHHNYPFEYSKLTQTQQTISIFWGSLARSNVVSNQAFYTIFVAVAG